MDGDFPLWRLRPEDAARMIILLPAKQVKQLPFEHKREMRSHPSKVRRPSNQDLVTWNKADHKHYWEAWKQDEGKEFPRIKYPVIAIMQGPLLKDGGFYSVPSKFNPEAKGVPWDGLYGRDQHDADIEALERLRARLRENFILGQRKEGPYIDGLVYMRADNLLIAEIAYCEAKLRFTWAILKNKRAVKKQAQPEGKWRNIGNDESLAKQFEHSGYKIRQIQAAKNHYEVLIT